MAFSDGPATGGVSVTPSDTVALPKTVRAFYVGGEGDISVLMPEGMELTLVGVPSGTVLPIAARRVNSTGTTATDLIGFY
jgi:hypothetical protein